MIEKQGLFFVSEYASDPKEVQDFFTRCSLIQLVTHFQPKAFRLIIFDKLRAPTTYLFSLHLFQFYCLRRVRVSLIHF